MNDEYLYNQPYQLPSQPLGIQGSEIIIGLILGLLLGLLYQTPATGIQCFFLYLAILGLMRYFLFKLMPRP